MYKSASTLIFAAVTIFVAATPFTSASADVIVRDHRTGGVVRDHRTICVVGDPNCRDHRDPGIVVPPRVQPEPPVTVIVDPIPPRPPVVVIDPVHTQDPPRWHDQGDVFGISCRQGRNILRHNGFRHIQAIDCEGSFYGYVATKRNRLVQVRMNLSGVIVSLRRISY